MRKQKNELDKVLILATATFLATLILVKSLPTHKAEAKVISVSEYTVTAHVEAPVIVSVVEETEPDLPSWVTQEDIDLMARVVMSEASVLPFEGKQAVAQTIVNRFYSDKFPNNIEAVIMAPNQYSTQDNGDPNEECYEAVDAALRYEGFPPDMYYFRTGHYHKFAHPYIQIGNTYFSTETEQ